MPRMPPKPKPSRWSFNGLALAGAFALLCTITYLSSQTKIEASVNDTNNSSFARPASRESGSVALLLQGQYEDLNGTEFVWQLPTSQPTKGVLLTFHGCSHGAIDWWPRSTTCPSCIGLPEEMHITRTALGRGYAVVAISSKDRAHSRCWAVPYAPHEQTVDIVSVMAVLHSLQQRQGFQGAPLYALGASSGGAFVLAMAAQLPVSAVCSQIMALPSTRYKLFLDAQPQEQQDGHIGAAPVLFVHMPRDTHTALKVQQSLELRQAKGLSSHVIEVQPQPLTEQLLARVPELAGSAGQQLLSLFKQHGIIDAAAMLQEDPRKSQWRTAVQQSGAPELKALNLVPDASGLSELLNMAYAQHEIIADTTVQMLEWFEQHTLKASAASR